MNQQDIALARTIAHDDSILPLDAFVRSISVNTEVGLLGAGASISSRIPSASTCIWQWKRSIFLSNHPGMERYFDELSLGMAQERIQDWLDTRPVFPRAGDAGEYGFYIDRCYPHIEDRRSFFQRHIQDAKLSSGYRIATLLAKNNLFRLVWTTNFDGLMARALSETPVTPAEIGLDSTTRIVRTNHTGEVSCVSLHGDYRYDALLNTDAELQRLGKELRQSLIDHSVSSPLIVLGYSGPRPLDHGGSHRQLCAPRRRRALLVRVRRQAAAGRGCWPYRGLRVRPRGRRSTSRARPSTMSCGAWPSLP